MQHIKIFIFKASKIITTGLIHEAISDLSQILSAARHNQPKTYNKSLKKQNIPF